MVRSRKMAAFGGAGLAVVPVRGRQRQIGITAERGDVRPAGDGAVPGNEGVVGEAERGAGA